MKAVRYLTVVLSQIHGSFVAVLVDRGLDDDEEFFLPPEVVCDFPAVPAVLQTAGLLILSRNVRHRLPFGRLFAVVEPQQ